MLIQYLYVVPDELIGKPGFRQKIETGTADIPKPRIKLWQPGIWQIADKHATVMANDIPTVYARWMTTVLARLKAKKEFNLAQHARSFR